MLVASPALFYRVVRRLRSGLLPLLGLLAVSAAGAVGSVQVQAAVDQTAAYRNGDALVLVSPPRLIKGRTLLPMREMATVLGQTVLGDATQLQVGRLSVDPRKPLASLDGVAQSPDSVVVLGNVVYVSAKLLADALNANLSFSDDGRSLTITALPPGGNPLTPQARFSTDKLTYAPGERVVYTEYAFDPDGSDLTSRKWTGRQDVYFVPGTYTVSLQVTNARGLSSAPFSRTFTVTGQPIDTPLSYALKYATPGDTFSDAQVLTYPAINAQTLQTPSYPLIFSDSPEAPAQSGILYQDSMSGQARLLAYHVNALSGPARLYVVARNLESRPVEVRTTRQGETAPTRIEGLLGQVTLLEYFASSGSQSVTVQPGESVAIYASPTLSSGSGVNMMQDVMASGRVELTYAMLEASLPPTAQVLQQLPFLQPDGRHQRGTFQNAVRVIRANLTQLPARLVIGDGMVDPAVTGVDALTNQPQQLIGNYGVLYDIEVQGVSGTAVALSPRGGLYRGAMNIEDGPIVQVLKLPEVGATGTPDQPTLLWRPASNHISIDFVPASGSNLPISLVFYRSAAPGSVGGVINIKRYTP
ncbi:copper amine oxidase N-terminal domain-containing protein [Deinococcus sp. KNUC1210]|uniref:stalk domain-containing protein n=1 Tax=Deinococcus sp. KNUC1210 TaxID=2917691 RepID=UPI001EEFA107|nr:stalk domain-containing protein [Deinococcus sp. KNUC1210]ULH14936.1 copper amine oxidase N-terminal domain-containing protein [Deinococcus sp. KNUC1210]